MTRDCRYAMDYLPGPYTAQNTSTTAVCRAKQGTVSNDHPQATKGGLHHRKHYAARCPHQQPACSHLIVGGVLKE